MNTQDQIIGILKKHQAGVTATDLCRRRWISDTTFYICRGTLSAAQSCGRTTPVRLLEDVMYFLA
ncbi:hypothetical protein [Acetobacter sp.]|jgi:hypothetical protein|uniref:hypothetical protein n=1 Tax=Acetobacter sp. TaxID=440 RepID=UPI0025B95CC5|nr:hypothetical protein [Acetobacter sp.]MCH4090145.1 hypothetical protein [Acetobacter sp.]MCI1298839.1 hypothetical protein [Acetobacter sp.]MCI1314859.1 hypothetical protein [Acetobacter sp.]